MVDPSPATPLTGLDGEHSRPLHAGADRGDDDPADVDRGDEDPIATVRNDWARERPDLDTTPMEIFGRLLRARVLAEAAINGVLEVEGLSLPSFDVLASLRRAGPPYRRTPTQLAATSMLTTGGVTFRLDRLEKAGLIRRIPSSEDRRVLYAELTDQGKQMIDAAFEAHLANEHRMLAGMSTEDAQQLARLLTQLEASITSQDAPER